jgi:hypothetical protein
VYRQVHFLLLGRLSLGRDQKPESRFDSANTVAVGQRSHQMPRFFVKKQLNVGRKALGVHPGVFQGFVRKFVSIL